MMMNGYSKLLGSIFFKTENGKVDKWRMIGFANTEYARIENIETKETKKVKYEELINDWTLLNPDGYIYFNIVELNDGIEDVIVCMYRADDVATNSADPYVVCRQNITDILGSLIDINTGNVGCCMSLETVPDGMDFKIMRACNSVKHFVSVACYTIDKLDDILHCIKKIKLYDDVLNTLFENSIKKFYPEFVWNMVKEENRIEYKGYCRSLKKLLEHNEFMYEVRRGFGIGTLDIDAEANTSVNIIQDAYTPSKDLIDLIEKQYNIVIDHCILMKYDKDINATAVKMDKILFYDSKEVVWILFFERLDESYIDTHVPNNDAMSPAAKIEAAFNANNL